MKCPNNEIIRINRKDEFNFSDILFLIGFPTFYLIIFYFIWDISNDILYHIIIISLAIICIIFPIIVIIPFEPLILYQNGIIPFEHKLKIFLFKKRNFIHFDNVLNIEKNLLNISVNNVETDIILSNGFRKSLHLRKKEIYELILQTFYEYLDNKNE